MEDHPAATGCPIAPGYYLIESGGRDWTIRIEASAGSSAIRELAIHTPRGDRTWSRVGILSSHGEVIPTERVSPSWVTAARALIAAPNPAYHGRLYARRSGNCQCCGRPLKDEASVARGIGPDCAARRREAAIAAVAA